MSNENSGNQTPNGAVKKRGLLILAVVLLLIVAGAVFWYVNRGKVVTDDAQVDGHVVPVSPRVSRAMWPECSSTTISASATASTARAAGPEGPEGQA